MRSSKSFDGTLKKLLSEQTERLDVFATSLSAAHERELTELHGEINALKALLAERSSCHSLETEGGHVEKIDSVATSQLSLDDDDVLTQAQPWSLGDVPRLTITASEDVAAKKPLQPPGIPSPRPPDEEDIPVLPPSCVTEDDWRRHTLANAQSLMLSMPSRPSLQDSPPNIPAIAEGKRDSTASRCTDEDSPDDDDGDDTFDDGALLEVPSLPVPVPRSRPSQRKSLLIVADRFTTGFNLTKNASKDELSIVPALGGKRNSDGRTDLAERKSMASANGEKTVESSLENRLALNASREESMVKPWPLWVEILKAMGDEVPDAHHGRRRQGVKNRINALKSRDLHLRESSEVKIAVFLQSLVLHPSSEKRLFWMVLSLLIILYDVIMIPMDPFELGIDSFQDVMAWVVAWFWIVNLFVSMFFGYNEKFEVELRFRKTAIRYAKTWMPLDLVLIFLDWYVLLNAVVNDGEVRNEASSVRAVKSIYVVRALRFIRLVRLTKVPANIQEAILLLSRSEWFSLSVGIIKHLFFILLINHVIACLWYMIGKGQKADGWVEFYMNADFVSDGDNWKMRYLTSLHWSLTQFTPATMAVQPRNLEERAFAVSVLLFAMVSFSSFVSSMTNMLNHLRTLKSAEAKAFNRLDRYLRDNQISFGLSLRVRRYLEHFMSESKRRPQEKDVELLKNLSEPLRMEIHYEVYSPAMLRHPFFLHYANLNEQAMRKLCHRALRELHLSTDDELFHSGETAKAMFFVKSGELEYRRLHFLTDTLEEGDWICEMVLWRPWEHMGTVKAVTECNLIELEATAFHTIVKDTQTINKVGEEDAIAYAFKATEILGEVEVTNLTDLDDIEVYTAANIAREVFGHDAADHSGFAWVLHKLEHNIPIMQLRSLRSMDDVKAFNEDSKQSNPRYGSGGVDDFRDSYRNKRHSGARKSLRQKRATQTRPSVADGLLTMQEDSSQKSTASSAFADGPSAGSNATPAPSSENADLR